MIKFPTPLPLGRTRATCGGTPVRPGDIIVAHDDDAVGVPVFLAEGGDLRTYYPLSDQDREEYEQWRREQDAAKGEIDK